MTRKCTSTQVKLCGSKYCETCVSRSIYNTPAMKSWCYEKNKGLNPYGLRYGCRDKCWFNCKCGHKFRKKLNDISRGSWCPYCAKANARLCDDSDCKMCFKRSCASHKKMKKHWSYELNECDPRDILLKSGKKCWFRCKCGHNFDSTPAHISGEDTWCPYCSGRKLCDEEMCEQCTERSCASHPKMVQCWSKRNGHVTPRDIPLYCNKLHWFDCKCKHSFQASPAHISMDGQWCPYCAGQKLCGDIRCKSCFDKSCASHEMMNDSWSSELNDGLEAHHVFSRSNKLRQFPCKECDHVFDATPDHISGKGNWCPYCSGHRLCGKEKCKSCMKRSCENHSRMKAAWDHERNGDMLPINTAICSNFKKHFVCENKHLFNMAPNSITTNGQWCGKCKNKTEKKLFDWLSTNCDAEITKEYKFKTCINKETARLLPLDYYIEKYKLIIELDGVQHFKTVDVFNNCPIQSLERDLYKTIACVKSGYTVIRILQRDVFYDKHDWDTRLLKVLRKHSSQKVILIDSNDEYKKLRDALEQQRAMHDVCIV